VTKFSTQSAAAAVGLVLAPLVPTIAFAFYAGTRPVDIISVFYGACLVYVVALVLGGLLGLPLLYLLGRLRQVNVWACVLAGFMAGAMSGILIILLTGIGANAVLSYGYQGAGAAAIFWVFWKSGPDPSATFAKFWTREFAGSRWPDGADDF
jgi:hypothetical protein